LATIQVVIKIDGEISDAIEIDVDEDEAQDYADSIRHRLIEDYDAVDADPEEDDDDDDDDDEDETGESEGPERF
jgi:hypothetical protein